MTDPTPRPIEGYRGFTIDASRVVRNRHGKVVKVTIRNGTSYVRVGNEKDGTRRMVQVAELWYRTFGPRIRHGIPAKSERDEMEHDAADQAAEGDQEINRMMENLRYSVKGRPVKCAFSLTMAGVLLGAVGQYLEGTREGRFERMMR